MADDNKQPRGFAQFTEGDVVTWIGSGETKIVANSDFLLSYGVKTGIFFGTNYDFTVGAKTSFFLGTSFDAKQGAAFEILKSKTLRVAGAGGFHYIDHHFASVGTDIKQKITMEAVRAAAWAVIVAQAALMTAAAAPALAWQIGEAKKKDFGPTYIPDAIGIGAVIGNAVIGLGVMIGILAGRFWGFGSTGKPVGMLSLHRAAKGAVFLGRRAPDGSSSGGLTMNDSGIDLSTANADLDYDKADTAIIGFKNYAGISSTGAHDGVGSRIRLNAKGSIEAWGKRMQVRMEGRSTHRATVHKLKAIDNVYKDTKSYLRVDDSSVLLQANNKHGFFASGDFGLSGILADKSFVKLTSDAATIGRSGNLLGIEKSKIELALGNTKLTIDSTGVTIGGELTILKPGGSGALSAELDRIDKAIEKLQKAEAIDNSQDKSNTKKEELTGLSAQQVDKSVIKVSDKGKEKA